MNYYNGPQPPPPPVYRTPPNPWNKPVRRNANIACVGLMLTLLLGFSLSPFFLEVEDFFVTGLEMDSPQTLSFLEGIIDLAVYLLMFLIPLTIMRLWIGIPLHVAFPMKSPRNSMVISAIFCCFGAAVVGMLSASAVAIFFKGFGLESRYYSLDPVGWPATIVHIIHVTVVAAIVEELVFRGVIMQSLRRFGDTFALVASSLLFGLQHQRLEQSVLAFVLGLAIGFFVLRSGSLKTGMLIHFTYNSSALIIDFATKNMPDSTLGAASLLVMTVYTGLGLIGIAILNIFYGGSLRLAKSAYPVAEGKKYTLFFTSPVVIIYLIFISIMIFTQLS